MFVNLVNVSRILCILEHADRCGMHFYGFRELNVAILIIPVLDDHSSNTGMIWI